MSGLAPIAACSERPTDYPHKLENLELLLPIRILTRGQLGNNLLYPCQALRKPKGINCGLELRVGMEIRAVRMPNRINCGKAESRYGTCAVGGGCAKSIKNWSRRRGWQQMHGLDCVKPTNQIHKDLEDMAPFDFQLHPNKGEYKLEGSTLPCDAYMSTL